MQSALFLLLIQLETQSFWVLLSILSQHMWQQKARLTASLLISVTTQGYYKNIHLMYNISLLPSNNI